MPENEEESGFDMEGAVNAVAEGLGFATEEEPAEAAETEDAPTNPPAEEHAQEQPIDEPAEAPPDPQVRPVPSSWAKEHHATWSKLPPEAQDYIAIREKQMLDGLGQYKTDAGFGKSMRDVVAPFKQIIDQQGVDEPTAVRFLLNAHQKLSVGTAEQRTAYFHDLAKRYGIDLGKAPQNPESPVDPRVQTLEEKLSRVESTLTAREQAELQQKRDTVTKQVDAFWSDPKHVYANEVSEEIVAFINAGLSLEEAYERAVYANPVTRQKEMNRLQTEADKERKEKLKAEAEAAKKARSANIRGRDTRRAPTEPLGTMDETMKSTLAEIRGRTH